MTSATDVAGHVGRITLVGAPGAVLVDEAALGLAGTRIGDKVRRLVRALGLDVVTLPLGDRSVVGPSLGVFGRPHPPVPDCHAFFVGPGRAPGWMRATDGLGPSSAWRILSLFGTGLAQERAGAAFRAAGSGEATPRAAAYDKVAILNGITEAVAPQTAGSAKKGAAAPPVFLGEGSRRDVLRRSVAALGRCCAANGAIAAAPRGSRGDPDYWFFWQRDAANVAVALLGLTSFGPDARARSWARVQAMAYVEFVAALGPNLGAHPGGAGFSRCTMDGGPVGGYGDPQPDGPAATCLAVLSIVPDPRQALEVAGPFLDFLTSGKAWEPGFDLWELTVGTSFHALNLSRRALRRAGEVAVAAGDPAARRYQDAAAHAAGLLREYVEPSTGHLVHVLDPLPAWFLATTGLDASVLGSILFAYDVDDEVLNLDDPSVRTTMALLEEHYDTRWPVNAAWRAAANRGGGIGRFPEDCNDGTGSTHGSPWPVATLWAAQYHLRRSERAAYVGVSPDPADKDLAIGYISFVLAHSDQVSVSEQIDAITGRPRGVPLLAWSQAELVTTLLALDPGPRPDRPRRNGSGSGELEKKAPRVPRTS